VPGASDIPLIRPFSRAGYRPLLEAGVRVFEWNGSMIHAKTAVADGRWSRVGSTNLNIASWLGNRELDVIVEHEPFAREMEDMFLHDLRNATEVVLQRNRVRAPGAPSRRHGPATSGGGSGVELRQGWFASAIPSRPLSRTRAFWKRWKRTSRWSRERRSP
jgi:cardiolipin synthase